jgi:hypothetical protein
MLTSSWRAASLERMMTFSRPCLKHSVMNAAAIPSLPPVTTATRPVRLGIFSADQGLSMLWSVEAIV